MPSAPVGYSPVSQQVHQLNGRDHVIDALITMDGKRDVLGVVSINGQTRLKVMGLFDRFLSLFLLTKSQREEQFDAQTISSMINTRIHDGVPELSSDQLQKIKVNLGQLNQRLAKKNVSLQTSINRLNQPAFQTQDQAGDLAYSETKPAICQVEPPLSFNEQEFRAAYKSLKGDLADLCYDPTIQVEPLDCRRTTLLVNPSDAFRMDTPFFRGVENRGVELLTRAQELFNRGDEHLSKMSADKKYELVRLLDQVIAASSDVPDASDVRKSVWRNAKALAATIPPSENEYTDRDAYCDAIKRRTV